jgi:hypothetical protein
MLRTRALLFFALSLATALAVLPAPSAATAPCWKRLINDWFDGRIDKVYPVSCYREALKHLPPDLEIYASARDDITRALAAVVAAQGRPPGSASPGSASGKGGAARAGGTSRDAGQPSGSGRRNGTGRQAGGQGQPPAGAGAPAGIPGRDTGKGGPLGQAIKDVGPDSADSVPIPLIVLGSLALLLLLLATLGFLARRLQARRTVRPAPQSRAQKP